MKSINRSSASYYRPPLTMNASQRSYAWWQQNRRKIPVRQSDRIVRAQEVTRSSSAFGGPRTLVAAAGVGGRPLNLVG